MSQNAGSYDLRAPETAWNEFAAQRIHALEHELLQARRELAHVARVASLGVLTAAIVHEVKQPLSGILTNAGTCLRILAADSPDFERARETARRTIRDCNRASDVITRLRRLFSNGDAAWEEVDLGEAASEMLSLAAAEMRRNRIVVRLELARGLPHVLGDRVQLQQVILNLVLNACEAMHGLTDRPKELEVRTDSGDEREVRLHVRDAGIGIEAGAADRLFQPFHSTKPGGMGIGLSVSRAIIESHRGRLWATPNDDGRGTTFTVSLAGAP